VQTRDPIGLKQNTYTSQSREFENPLPRTEVRGWHQSVVICRFEMTLGHVRALARTIQGRLCGFFYGYLDQLESDSAHQRGTEGAVQVSAIWDRKIGVLTQTLKAHDSSRLAALEV
jgi:hypothetical protein